MDSVGSGTCIDRNGTLFIADYKKHNIFASDPNWSQSTGQIWRIIKNGVLHLLESNMGTTNGIEVSPGDKKLYVNESVHEKYVYSPYSPIWRNGMVNYSKIRYNHLFHFQME